MTRNNVVRMFGDEAFEQQLRKVIHKTLKYRDGTFFLKFNERWKKVRKLVDVDDPKIALLTCCRIVLVQKELRKYHPVAQEISIDAGFPEWGFRAVDYTISPQRTVPLIKKLLAEDKDPHFDRRIPLKSGRCSNCEKPKKSCECQEFRAIDYKVSDAQEDMENSI